MFTDYIQPLITWLHVNPHWSLFFTFLISLSESFAIIGVIVPGSVTMTAVGILAGSGVIRIDLTLAAAILGAVAGDSLSYAVGYYYSDRILEVWPFKKYPSWLAYGKEFFERHGGKSVLLGRFVGPLRALTPIIAGIMHMPQGRFLIANVLSAIGWSLLYVLPGVLIGAASSELSPESATRLFIIVIILLCAIWFISVSIKFLFNKLSFYLKKNLHIYWLHLKKHPFLYRFFHMITPAKEDNHYRTVLLFLLSCWSLFCFLVLFVLQLQGQWLNDLNVPIYLLLKSFPAPSLQAFFIACTQLTSMFTMACLLLLCFCYFLYNKNYRILYYLLSTVFFSFLIAYAFTKWSPGLSPQGLSQFWYSFPAIHITMASAFYSFIYFYFASYYNFLTYILRTLLFIVLGLSSLGAIYLGDYWFGDVIAAFCLGSFVCLVHCLMYRKLNPLPRQKRPSPLVFFSIVGSLFFSSGLSTALHFKTILREHTVIRQEYYITEENWWNQQRILLPFYLYNRVGKRISVLNIQYIGDLYPLENNLRKNHWASHTESFFTKIMQRINQKSNTVKLPLFELLLENKRPNLLMTLNDTSSQFVLELRLWQSAYYVKESNQAIWIGSLRFSQQKKPFARASKSINPLTYLLPSLEEFSTKTITFAATGVNTKGFYSSPTVLLIKKKET